MNLVFSLEEILACLLGMLVGAALVWRYCAAHQRLMTLQFQNALQQSTQAFTHTEKSLQEKVLEVLNLQGTVNNLRAELGETCEVNSVLRIQMKDAQLWRNQLSERDKQLDECREQLAVARMARLEALTRFEVQQHEFVEKERLLAETHQHFSSEFQLVANRLFDEKSERFSQHSKAQIGEILVPLREQLTDFRRKVEDVYDKEAKDRMALHREISLLRDLNVRISQDAENLAHALKGDNKTQGTWGELVLERVLEMSGLVKGREFETQPAHRGEEGNFLRPDVIVHLPDGKDVVIDSKVSLLHWESYCSATEDAIAQEAMRGHLQSLRNHIKSLSAKNYANLPGVKSLDFVLLFIPVEAAFLKAMQIDPQLFADAYAKGLMLVCPSTLLVTLRTIQNLWRYEYQNRNALKIAECAGGLHDQFVMVIEGMKDVGDKLVKTSQSFDNAWKRMADGKGNVIKRVADLEKLGAKARRKLVVNDEADDEIEVAVIPQTTDN